jgi:inosose dehydratase
MRLGYHSITWGGVVGEATGVTSAKNLVYRSNGSTAQAFRDIAAAGYEGIELFDGNAADLAADLGGFHRLTAETGLRVVSVYCGANFIYSDILPDEMYRIELAADSAVLLGAERLVVGGGARRASGTTDDDYRRLGAALDQVVQIAGTRGLKASFHPHLTTIVESPEEIDRIMEFSRIDFCPDTAHLAAGGGDPGALIRRYAGRIGHVHLKDFRDEPFAFLPLGKGALDFPDVLAALRDADYDSWLLVELDSYDGDPAEAARISRSYLDKLLADH